MSGTTSRRDAVRRGAALAGGALAVGSLGLARAARAAAKQADDAATLTRLIELEQRAALAYRELADGDLLDEEVRKAAEVFAQQEDAHAEALIAALEELGGTAPEPPRTEDIEGLDELDRQKEALELAIDLENALVRAYDDAAETFTSFALLKTCSQIVANEGQHLAVAREQLGLDPVPEAFERGEAA